MEIKKFDYKGKLTEFYCYDMIPENGPFEAVFVLKHYLNLANNFIEETYKIYKDKFPKLVKPKVYLCFYNEDFKDINAFTDGVDIYILVGLLFGMDKYINERLSTMKSNGESLLLKGYEDASKALVYDYIIELVIAHELIHVWHRHKLWKKMNIKFNYNKCSITEIIEENSTISECNDDDIENCVLLEIDNYFILENDMQYNLIQQVLELDSDCLGISLVVDKMLRKTQIEYNESVNYQKIEENKRYAALTFSRSQLIGYITLAAGLMLGYFNNQYENNQFNSLNALYVTNHPINAIRFFLMEITIFQLIHNCFIQKETKEILLKETKYYSVDTFSHKNGIRKIQHCFWAPVYTEIAQTHIIGLKKIWNQIQESLSKYSIFEIYDKFSESDMALVEEAVWFDNEGNRI